MKEKEEDEKEEKGHRVEITVAIIGLVGVLGTAVISNIDKLVQRPATDTHSSANNDTRTPETPPKNVDTQTSETPPKNVPQTPEIPPKEVPKEVHAELPAETLAEQLVSQCVGAILSEDVNTLVTIATVPYFLNSELLVREEDVRKKYDAFFSEPRRREAMKGLKIVSLTVKTMAARRSEGYDSRNFPVLKELTLSDDDFMGLASLNNGQHPGRLVAGRLVIFVRRVGKELKVAGFTGS